MTSFSYTARTGLSEVSVTLLIPVLVSNFSYTPHAMFDEEFLLYS